MRTLIGLSLLLMVAACGDKKPVEGQGSAKITAEIPSTPEAKAFAKRLVALSITDWEPTSANTGAGLNCSSLDFLPDGSWEADCLLTASYEEFACQEYGKWRMDSAESSDTANMDWELVKTTCPMREPGVQRVKMSILADGTYKILFR